MRYNWRVMHVTPGRVLAYPSRKGLLLLLSSLVLGVGARAANLPLRPTVEVEEDVYTYQSADNGAGPMWCGGSTCLARVGEDLFASGIETLKDAKPLNNCRWLLFRRRAAGWEQVMADAVGRTREPSPLAAFPDGSLFLSANPTLVTNREAYNGPARPEILQFNTSDPRSGSRRVEPLWDGDPRFTEHSYRSFAADGPNRELILFQNVDYTHAEWAFRDRQEKWSGQGKLKWPWGAGYDKPQPIRVCYPTVALKNRSVYFCGVSDIVEPYGKWRTYKKELTGKEWDYDFRRLFYTYCPDITSGKFSEWVEIASRDQTCGWISPGDLWVATDGAVHIVWTERAIDPRLREKFFPNEKQSQALNYAVVRDGRVVMRRTLAASEEGGSSETPSGGRLHATPEGRLFVFYYVGGTGPSGKAVSENRLMELTPDRIGGAPVKVPFQHPFQNCFTATPRAGSAPSTSLDLLGERAGSSRTIS